MIRFIPLAAALCFTAAPAVALTEPPAAPAVAATAAAASGFIRAEGTRFVNPDGSTFHIKGMSFGNWLLPEGYMFKFTVQRSPQDIEDVIEYLAGPEEAARFWRDFREAYIQEEDVAFLAASGFTTVRVPLHWKFFLDPANPDRVDPDGEGWARIDRLVGWARAHDIKLILDIHAAPPAGRPG
ncbi:cellulase family glycosylhydrolase [Ancylobacter dichloromethanicus]